MNPFAPDCIYVSYYLLIGTVCFAAWKAVAAWFGAPLYPVCEEGLLVIAWPMAMIFVPLGMAWIAIRLCGRKE